MKRLLLLVLCLVLPGCRSGSKSPEPGALDAGPKSLSEVEPNDRPEAALTLSESSVVQGALTVDPTRADEDWYLLATSGLKAVDVQLSGIPGADVALEIYDTDRNRLAGVNSEGDGQPERLPNLGVKDRLYLKVYSAKRGSGGSYVLALDFRTPEPATELEPNDRAADAIPLALGTPVSGYLGHAGDEDWYRIELAPSPVPGEVPSPDASPAQPSSPSPSPVPGSNDSTGSALPPRPVPPPVPRGPPPPSPAEALIDPPEEDVEAETVEGEPAAAPTPPPDEVPAGEVYDAGALSAADAGSPVPIEPEAVALKIGLTPVEGVKFDLAVLSAAEAPLFRAQSPEGEGLSLRNVGVRTQDRVLFVVVKSAWIGTGKDARRGHRADKPYQLTVSLEEAGATAELEPNDAPAKATFLPRDGYREGFISPKGDVDYYVMRADTPALIRLQLSGVERMDLMMSVVKPPALEGKREEVLMRANEGGVKEPEYLNNLLCTGECYVRVEAAPRMVDGKQVKDAENAEQPYRLTATAVADPGAEEQEPNNQPARATPLVVGRPMRGTVYPKKDVDFYRLDLSDRPVRTALRATLLGILKVDVALFLHRLDDDGKPALVQTSNRAKGEAPEVIRYSAEPGIYFLEVRDSRNRESNFQDSYQLTVQEGE